LIGLLWFLKGDKLDAVYPRIHLKLKKIVGAVRNRASA